MEEKEPDNTPAAAVSSQGAGVQPPAAGLDEDGCPGGEDEDCDPAAPQFPSWRVNAPNGNGTAS